MGLSFGAPWLVKVGMYLDSLVNICPNNSPGFDAILNKWHGFGAMLGGGYLILEQKLQSGHLRKN